MFDEDSLSNVAIDEIVIKDLRFPAALEPHGPEALDTRPGFACTYVIIKCSGTPLEGHGLTFTLGMGNEIVCATCKFLADII